MARPPDEAPARRLVTIFSDIVKETPTGAEGGADFATDVAVDGGVFGRDWLFSLLLLFVVGL